MAYKEFNEFPNLIEYYTTIGNGTLLKEEYTTIKECTILEDIEHFLYLTQSYISDDTSNQILHLMSTLILWSKTFYTTVGQYPTLYDYLAIMQEDLIHWEYHLDHRNTGVSPKNFQSTCTLGRCPISCVIQVKQMTQSSVIPPIRYVHPYVSLINHPSVIPPT